MHAEGYRVMLLLKDCGRFVEYTGRKKPVTLEMAQTLGAHLKRNKTGGQIVRIPGGEIIEEWKA